MESIQKGDGGDTRCWAGVGGTEPGSSSAGGHRVISASLSRRLLWKYN